MHAIHPLAALVLCLSGLVHASYDPMRIPEEKIRTIPLEAIDKTRQRTLPVRAYLPTQKDPAPLILFSHGLGGSRDNNPYLGNHWAARGYIVVFVQHPGSDERVWKDAPGRRLEAMREAASAANYLARTRDIPAVIDQLASWNQSSGHELHGRINLDRIGMSGHSFGAQTTQAMAGQQAPRLGIQAREARIDAALILSPSPPAAGDPAAAFAPIRIPCLLMTGTLDDNPISGAAPETRLHVFPHLRNAPAWQVVFDGARHSDFGQRRTAGAATSRYHSAILALSTAFWDATLRDDEAAASWLEGGGAKKVLNAADDWRMNERATMWKP